MASSSNNLLPYVDSNLYAADLGTPRLHASPGGILQFVRVKEEITTVAPEFDKDGNLVDTEPTALSFPDDILVHKTWMVHIPNLPDNLKDPPRRDECTESELETLVVYFDFIEAMSAFKRAYELCPTGVARPIGYNIGHLDIDRFNRPTLLMQRYCASVYEWLARGREGAAGVTFDAKVRCVRDVAQTLVVLHDAGMVVGGHWSTSNIMIDGVEVDEDDEPDWNCPPARFLLSDVFMGEVERTCFKHNLIVSGDPYPQGDWAYLPVETLQMSPAQFTQMQREPTNDIWAIGTLMRELFTSDFVHMDSFGDSFRWLGRVLTGGVTLHDYQFARDISDTTPDWMYGRIRDAMNQCLTFDPRERITARGLVLLMNELTACQPHRVSR